jgi:UDPglucose 6-dehydrogenase
VAAVARGVGRALSEAEEERTRPLIVVTKSTVPVGSGDCVSMLIVEGTAKGDNKGAVDYRVVSNPEFMREGSAVYDTLFPERIVLGPDKRNTLDTMRALYEPIMEQSFPTELDPRPKAVVPFVTTDLASAEMIKYAANAFLATKISFINEIPALLKALWEDDLNSLDRPQ